jgi:transcriptional regulator with XRE-family HTH domain
LSDTLASAVFAKRLKQARELRGLSQRALGDALGLGKRVGSTRINRYEQQVSLCDMETASKIARELGVPLAYLFAESDDLAELILAYAQLSKADRAKALADLKLRLPQKTAR